MIDRLEFVKSELLKLKSSLVDKDKKQYKTSKLLIFF